jgi:hypothetical protein
MRLEMSPAGISYAVQKGEAIAILAFAYALLQPKEAYEILAPLLSIGREFQEFYGVTEAGTNDICVPTSSENIGRKTDNAGV